MATMTVRIESTDRPRLEALRQHPRETVADVVKRLLDEREACVRKSAARKGRHEEQRS